jgi:hypothetical protein
MIIVRSALVNGACRGGSAEGCVPVAVKLQVLSVTGSLPVFPVPQRVMLR